MSRFVFDCEGDGLYATKIHCISYNNLESGERANLTGKDEMRTFLTEAEVLIGHNITRFDIPTLERVLGVTIKARLIDTLSLSWYLYPDRIRHGLEWWGNDLGIKKPEIDDWENLSLEEYCHRCSEDVEINTLLWEKQWKYLLKLYGSDKSADRLVRYLQFKMDCAAEQERSGWKLDIGKCKNSIDRLQAEYDKKFQSLKEAMPKVELSTIKTRPKKPFKADGTYSVVGAKWFALLKKRGLPEDFKEELKVVSGYEDPNPGSTVQVKRWLFDLGWVPATFKYERRDSGVVDKIPQVRVDKGGEKSLCESVLKLKGVEPSISYLEGITVLSHRLAILKGFLDNADEDGYVQAQIQGLTNTLRFKHKVVVNLPSVAKAYGEDIRGCLVAPEGYELCGSDMSSLEDRTKQHYMWKHDPEYVREMLSDDFDPHLDIAVMANLLTQKQADDHKAGVADYGTERKSAKVGNYACTYGAKAPTVARGAGISVSIAEKVVDGYWKRNWSIIKIAEECEGKICNKQKWLYNPVSKMWYSLRHEKDRFSTLNQGTGVYCFDTWIRNVREKRPQLTAQFHDEGVWCIKKGFREQCKKLLNDAIERTNSQLKLNRRLDIDIQFGESYADIH